MDEFTKAQNAYNEAIKEMLKALNSVIESQTMLRDKLQSLYEATKVDVPIVYPKEGIEDHDCKGDKCTHPSHGEAL